MYFGRHTKLSKLGFCTNTLLIMITMDKAASHCQQLTSLIMQDEFMYIFK